jgi:hypothetical protein
LAGAKTAYMEIQFKKAILLILLLVCALFLGGIINHASGDIETKMVYEQELFIRELTIVEQQKIFIYENFGDYKTYKLMVKIINCESGWKIDAVNLKSRDFGLFQISEKYWDKFAQTTSFADYKTNWKSNVLLAKYIYSVQGISAWNWSKFCWSK